MGEYKKQIDEMEFSFSRCNSFEGCKYEWYLNYLLKDENGKRVYNNEQNFYAAFGSFCHAILERIFTEEMNVDNSVDYYKVNFDEEVQCYDVPESTREKYFYLGLDYFATLDLTWLDEYEVLGVEKKCEFTINGRRFIGYIDLLLRHKKSKEIIVIDHKSSEYPLGKKGQVLKKKLLDYERYKIQLYMYCEQVFKEYGVYPSKIVWNYFKEKKWLELPFIYAEFKDAKEWATKIIDSMYLEENFVPSMDYFYCNNLCGFRNSCDYKLMGGE